MSKNITDPAEKLALHWRVRELYQEGKTLKEIAVIMGWKTTTTVTKYLHWNLRGDRYKFPHARPSCHS